MTPASASRPPDAFVTVKHSSNIVYSASQDGGSAQVGLAVTLSDDDTVDLAGDGEHVYGKLTKVYDDGYCVVQRKGFATLPGGGASRRLATVYLIGIGISVFVLTEGEL